MRNSIYYNETEVAFLKKVPYIAINSKDMERMPQLTVYKASAGSGKTWRLTVEYLRLLVMQPDAYRHILAVTFTNKAAGEMKDRVLNSLYDISIGKGDEEMLKTICEETGLKTEQVRKRSDEALHLLLHDYGRFHIETIDSFFQTVLRNLARELGLGSSFNIDLDNKAVLDKAVAQLYEHASDNRSVLEWMESYIEDQLRDGKSRNVANALKSFGENIFKEYFQQHWDKLSKELKDKNFLKEYKKALNQLAAEKEKLIKQEADKFNNILAEACLTINDLTYKSSGAANYFLKLQRGDFEPDYYTSARLQGVLADPSKWAPKSHPRCKEIEILGREKLNPLVEACETLRSEHYKTIISARLTIAHLYKVGLLSDIASETEAINIEDNRFLLSNTGALLSGMMDGSDAPFIFEKTGIELEHIMIDEFQDTSHTQWNNFKPLLLEGLGNGHDSLIVGDEKQSIYRFRNGDWQILGDIKDDLPGINKEIRPLEKNFRSEKNIVEFNNMFFQTAVQSLTREFEETIGKKRAEGLSNAYASITQKCTKEDSAGFVKVRFLGKDNYENEVLNNLVKDVEKLQHQGITPQQIAILVRKNKDIPIIADYFARYRQCCGLVQPEDNAVSTYDPSLCYEIVSDEAFLLSSSTAIRALVAAMKMVLNPSDGIAEEEFRRQYSLSGQLAINLKPLPSDFSEKLLTLRQLPLTEMVESLCNILDISSIKGQESYMFSFLDRLNDFVGTTSSDLGEFLSYWEETMQSKPIPMGTKLNGIRILSIHKSKGLEYHTVIVPFASWKLLNEARETVWCEAPEEPYNQLSLIPVDYTKSMAGSIYGEAYREETLQLLIDSLNTLYVAFTRAEKNLIVLSRMPDVKKWQMASVADLLHSILSGSGQNFNTETGIYTSGNLCTKPDKDKKEAETISVSFESHRHRAGFRQSNRSREFLRQADDDTVTLSSDGYTNTFIEHGKLMHYIFENIIHLEDVETAIAKAVSEGLLPKEQATETCSNVEKALRHPIARSWWEGDFRLYNECSILFRDEEGNLQEKRPDRVILRGNSIEVVDYKFGKPLKKHFRQVQQYMSLLSAMGFENVKGWLWYVEENDVKPVISC